MRILLCTEIMVIFMIAGGCVATYGGLEKDRGNSYRLAKSNQILNPAAETNLKPVVGLSGAAVQENMQNYVQSFGKSSNQPLQNNKTGK